MFIDNEDYRIVIGEAALKVVSQSSPENIANAETEAIEETEPFSENGGTEDGLYTQTAPPCKAWRK